MDKESDPQAFILMCKLLSSLDVHYFDLPERVALNFDAVADYYGVETQASRDTKTKEGKE